MRLPDGIVPPWWEREKVAEYREHILRVVEKWSEQHPDEDFIQKLVEAETPTEVRRIYRDELAPLVDELELADAALRDELRRMLKPPEEDAGE